MQISQPKLPSEEPPISQQRTSDWGATAYRPYPKLRQHKQCLYDVDREAICRYHFAHPTETQELIARKFGVERSTISKTLKEKEKWANIELGNTGELRLSRAKHRLPKFPVIESVMLKWLLEVSGEHPHTSSPPGPSPHPSDPHTPPSFRGPYFSDACLREKASFVARSHGIPLQKFKASAGWVEGFKRRHNIKNGFWGGYLRTVQGRKLSDVMVPNGTVGLGFFINPAPVTPPLLASSYTLHSQSTYRLVPSSSKAESQTEDSTTENDQERGRDGSRFAEPLSHVHDSIYPCPPWASASLTTSDTRDDSVMSSHTPQHRCIFDRSSNSEVPEYYPTDSLAPHHEQVQIQCVLETNQPNPDCNTVTVEHDGPDTHAALSPSKYRTYHYRSSENTSRDGRANFHAHPTGVHVESSCAPPATTYNRSMHRIHSDTQNAARPLLSPSHDTLMPTLEECEDFLAKLSTYVDEGPGRSLLSTRKRGWLRKIKVAFFEASSGLPITPDSDEGVPVVQHL